MKKLLVLFGLGALVAILLADKEELPVDHKVHFPDNIRDLAKGMSLGEAVNRFDLNK